jgi:hypothetical protein
LWSAYRPSFSQLVTSNPSAVSEMQSIWPFNAHNLAVVVPAANL